MSEGTMRWIGIAKRRLLVSLVALAVVLPAPNSNLRADEAALPISEAVARGKEAYDKKDYTAALKFYRIAADQGDGEAEDKVGAMYAFGQGVEQDYAQALGWYRRAAEHGHPGAATNI